MRIQMTRLAAMVILIGAIFGLVISLYGLFALWSSRPAVVAEITDLVQIANRTFDATDGMLQATDDSISKASLDLTLMQTMLTDTASSIGQSTSTVKDTARMMGEDMPKVIKNAQDALTSTQSTSQFIDDTLHAISSIPFIGPSLTSRYTPKVPLSQSVEQVNRSLDPLSGSFTQVQKDLNTATANMATIQAEIESLSKNVSDIQTSLSDAQTEVRNYKLILADTRDRFDSISKRLPAFIDVTFLGVTVFLIWVGISQLGALLMAMEILTRRLE